MLDRCFGDRSELWILLISLKRRRVKFILELPLYEWSRKF